MSSTGQEIPSFTKLAHTAGEGINSKSTAVSDSIKENIANMKDKFDDNVVKPINDTIDRKAEDITAVKEAADEATEREKTSMLEKARTYVGDTMTAIGENVDDKVTKPINNTVERKAEDITAARKAVDDSIEREKPGMFEKARTYVGETMTNVGESMTTK